MHHTARRLLELLVEALIGVALVAAVFLYVEFGPFRWMPSARWWMLAAVTLLILGYTTREFRRHWRRSSFWLNMAWLTALHLVAWIVLLHRAPDWPLLWFVPAGMGETALVVYALWKFGYAV